MTSILQDEKVCFFCGTTHWLEEHHIFGASNRKHSEKFGLKLYLCKRHHEIVHRDADTALILKKRAQMAWEERYGNRNDFMRVFGRSYLGSINDTTEE